MKLKIIWPGKTQNQPLRALQEYYLKKIERLEKCMLIETKEAKGISECHSEKIKEIEASGLEKHLKDDYIICLSHKGKAMSSEEFAKFLEREALTYPHFITFVVGGFLGLSERVLKKADCLLSLSRMTLSHELTRIVLLEQIYRSLTIIRGTLYAK